MKITQIDGGLFISDGAEESTLFDYIQRLIAVNHLLLGAHSPNLLTSRECQFFTGLLICSLYDVENVMGDGGNAVFEKIAGKHKQTQRYTHRKSLVVKGWVNVLNRKPIFTGIFEGLKKTGNNLRFEYNLKQMDAAVGD